MKLAIFDFDGTLFPKDTLPFMLSQWKSLGYSKNRYYKAYISLIGLYILYKLGINTRLSKEQMRIIAMERFNSIFDGMSEQEVDEYLSQCTELIKEQLNHNVVSELDKARAEGYHTVLLSGAYDTFLKKIGDHLRVDSIIGTKMNFCEGMFDSNKELDITCGEAKLEKLSEFFKGQAVDWKSSLAYADSYSDIHILKSVGQPVVVNPDSKLKSIADESNWRII